MKRRLGIGALLLLAVGLLGLGLVGAAAAQGGPGPRGGASQQGGPGGQRGAMVQAVADLLGMTPDQIRAERQGGKSLAAIAAERGVDQTTLVQTVTNAMVPRIQQFVGRMVNREGSGRPEGRGPREGRDARGFRGGPGQGLFRPVADLLGMTPDQVVAERRAGKSLADIAAARGVDQATLVQAITVTARARLDEQVAAGRLTAERADAIYQRIQQRAPQFVTSTENPRFGRGGAGRPDRPDGPGRGPGGSGRGPGGPGPSDSAPTP
jgi:lambda repressor-like predicted transcriptional regulator